MYLELKIHKESLLSDSHSSEEVSKLGGKNQLYKNVNILSQRLHGVGILKEAAYGES